MQLAALVGKNPAKHPIKGTKTLPVLSSPVFWKAQKMTCKTCCQMKKKNYYHFIKVWKIKNIFLSITRSLSLEFDLWPPGGLCTVLAWCYHTHPQMASLRLLHSQLFIYIYIYLIASVTDFLQSLRASKQDHSVMHSRDRQENKINEKSTEVLSLLTSFKWILARKLRIEVNCFGISPFR